MDIVGLDRKDKEILFHLSLDGRATLSKLGKKTRLSKEVVHHRIKNLEKKGIIEQYYVIINTYKLGKVFYRVHMKTANMGTKRERAFVAYLKQHPKVTWIVETEGNMDFLYVVWAKDIIAFKEVFEEINDKFGKYMTQRHFSVMTDVHYFKQKYLLGKDDCKVVKIGGKIECPTLGKLDEKMISYLSRFGRASLTAMAKKFKVTVKTVQQHKKELEKKGIIVGYTTKINHKKIGYTQRKVMLMLNDTTKKMLKKLITYLSYSPCVIYITQAIGSYDIEFEMMEKTYEEFHVFMKEMKNEFSTVIRAYDSVIFYNEPKVGQM